MPETVYAIARRLEHQWPFGALTLGGEIEELPERLAEAGVSVGRVESNIPAPPRHTSLGPGAVGFSKHREPTS
jgi:hypothetical protein